ncbi:outer membrane protein transport protein [bacterium BMS3Abin05]|nr:outer membrane protein transport protein [bacterium BMS3Abin05]GBE28355.1 outer membrane protein transport protein [bacterium BMS3Bbin03]
MRKTLFAMSIGIFFLIGTQIPNTQSQEIVPLLGQEFGVGARALGMGGAFVGVADDYSATHWNPAGLGLIRKMEWYGSLSRYGLSDNVTIGSLTTTDRGHFSRLNAGGFVFPIPTYQGSLVFALGYNRVRNLDGVFNSKRFISTPGDSVYRIGDELEIGYLGYWNFSGSVQLSPNFYIGGAINFWGGTDNYNWKYYEFDALNIWTFNTNILAKDQINTKFSGTNIKMGGLFTLGHILNVGGTISTPLTLLGKENWYHEANTIIFDNGSVQEGTKEKGYYEYKIQKPYSFAAGVALKLPLLLLSGDVEYNDWSQIQYKSPDSLTAQNENLMKKYRETLRYRLGAELTVPFTGIKLRGGYMFDPSPYQQASLYSGRKFLTAGIGFIIDRQYTFDFAWMHGWWKHNPGNYVENITADKVLFTAAFRF